MSEYRGPELQRSLMFREIARLVADAKASDTIICTTHHAALLFATSPDANFSIGRIAEELVEAAREAGVASDVS